MRSATVPGHCRGWCGRDRPRSSIVALQWPAPLHARRRFAGSVSIIFGGACDLAMALSSIAAKLAPSMLSIAIAVSWMLML